MTKPKTTKKTTTVVEPHLACEVAVTGILKPGVIAHKPKISTTHTEAAGGHRWYEEITTICTGELAKACSYGWAKSHGATACPACFGGAR